MTFIYTRWFIMTNTGAMPRSRRPESICRRLSLLIPVYYKTLKWTNFRSTHIAIRDSWGTNFYWPGSCYHNQVLLNKETYKKKSKNMDHMMRGHAMETKRKRLFVLLRLEKHQCMKCSCWDCYLRVSKRLKYKIIFWVYYFVNIWYMTL